MNPLSSTSTSLIRTFFPADGAGMWNPISLTAGGDARIVMHHLVPHADDVRPRDSRMTLHKLIRYLASSLTDDLNEMDQRQTEVLVGVVRLAREPLSLRDSFLAM